MINYQLIICFSGSGIWVKMSSLEDNEVFVEPKDVDLAR
jgi:hypothetical protein